MRPKKHLKESVITILKIYYTLPIQTKLKQKKLVASLWG